MVAKRVFFYSAASLIAAGLILFVFLEPFINTPPVKHWIVNQIEQHTGTRLDPDQVRFRVKPRPGIEVEHLELPLTRDIGLSIDTVHLDLDMHAVLEKKISVSRIFLKGLDIRTTPGESVAGPTFHAPMVFQFPKEQMDQMFALLPDSEKPLQVALENSATQQFSALTGSLWISKTEQTLQFDTRIQDLHLTKDWLARFFSAPDFRLQQLTSRQARLHVRLNPVSGITGQLTLDRFAIHSDRLTAPVAGDEARMHFSYQPDQVSFDLAPTSLTYPFASVSMAFSNHLARGTTELTFQGRQVDIAQARETSLAMGSDSRVVRELFDILRNGMASEVSVGFAADSWDTLFDPRHLVLEGTAEKARVKIPATPLMADDVNGTARVSEGILHIVTSAGTVERSDMNQGDLSIDLLHPSHVPFAGEFDLDVDLAEVPDVLARLLPDTELGKEMARVSDLSGRASIRLTLAVEPDHPDLRVSVTTHPFSATGFYDRIPFPLTVSRAAFSYESNQVRITGLSGTIGKSQLTNASAQITVGDPPFLDLSVAALEIDVHETWPELYSWKPFQVRLGPVTRMDGRLMVNGLTYKGPMFDLVQGRFDLAGTAHDIRIGFSPAGHEIMDLSGAFKASENQAAVTHLTARIMDLDWLSKWIPPAYSTGIPLPVQVESGSLYLDNGRVTVSGQAELAPNVRLSVQMSGHGPNDLKPDVIELEHKPLTNAVFRFVQDSETTRIRFDGKLDTRTIEPLIDKTSAVHQKLAALTGGEPVEISSGNDHILNIRFRQLQLEALAGWLKGTSMSDTPQVFPWTDLSIHADIMTYGLFHFSDIDVKISQNGHGSNAVLETADLSGIKISGRMGMDLSTPDRQTVTEIVITTSDNENIDDLVSCFFPDKHLLDGIYSLEATLSGTGPLQQVPMNLTGDITFESVNGRIHKMTLLSRLLSVLNILKLPDIRQEGFQYHRIQVKALLKNGGIHLEKAVIDAENMALFFSGEIHPFENRLDLTCLVAPFKTIDTIVQFIPVVNTILEGRLVSFPAKATGPIDDPVITPLHPSAVGEGLINMFTSLLKSPARLLESVPNAPIPAIPPTDTSNEMPERGH